MQEIIVRTKVAGVTFEGRQDVVSQLSPGQELDLQLEPDNPHDAFAIAVLVLGGAQIGYVRAFNHLNAEIHDLIIKGREIKARVVDITGGQDGQSYGCNIEIYEVKPFQELQE